MDGSLLDFSTAVPTALSGTGLPHGPTPGQFWAVVTWVIIPGVLLIWMAYHQRRERLRHVRRRLRQLEVRLAAATPPKPEHASPLPRPALSPRPSALTARILLPASGSTAAIPVFGASLPGQAS